MKYLLTGFSFENDGGALMLETYSKATVQNCYFAVSEAADNGGAIYMKIRSQIARSQSTVPLSTTHLG